jgi:phospholipid/cholesterol/gamma-HCH transport system ATP-binding protein
MDQHDQAADTQPVLRFEEVSLRFEEGYALERVSFQITRGETSVFLGAAGSGKTVLLKTAVGLIKPDAGRVFLFGQDITDLEEQDLYEIRGRVGILFQEGGLFDSLNIEDNVAYPLLNQKIAKEMPYEQVRARVEEALSFVELEHTLEKFPSELSGGMRRRVGIARATVTQPPLVLYDSPTAGLDPITANTIVALIVKERDTQNTTSCVVTHRYQDGHMIANFRYNPRSGQLEPVARNGGRENIKTVFRVMREGRLVFEGSQAELESSRDQYVSKFARR